MSYSLPPPVTTGTFETITAAGVPGIYYAWYSDFMPHDHEMRGFIIALSNMFSYIQSIWWTLTVWRTVLAPRFHAAFIGAACLGVALCALAILLRYLEARDKGRRVQLDDASLDNASTSSTSDRKGTSEGLDGFTV